MLNTIDLSLSIEQSEYERQFSRYQAALNQLTYQVYINRRPVVLVFEGWNASGKGEAIRKITQGIDPRGFAVHAHYSSDEEHPVRHYLWPYWRNLPESGRIAIFDQSWYRRVLRERVEKIRSEDEWQRAYREINNFERQLVDFGTIVHKFWLHIDRDEQIRRFEARAEDQLHPWRLLEDDWQTVDKREQYGEAINQMLLKTNTLKAPWTVIEANSERYAQLKILKTIVNRISQELDYDPFSPLKFAQGKKKKKKSKK